MSEIQKAHDWLARAKPSWTYPLNSDQVRWLLAEIDAIRSAASRPTPAPSAGEREALADILRRFHQDSCYPDAMDGEISQAVDAIASLLRGATERTPEGYRVGTVKRVLAAKNGPFEEVPPDVSILDWLAAPKREENEAVFSMCRYLHAWQGKPPECKHCPESFEDKDYGKMKHGCRCMAEEAIKIATGRLTYPLPAAPKAEPRDERATEGGRD